MRMVRRRGLWRQSANIVITLLVACSAGVDASTSVFAQTTTSSSAHYEVTQTAFGSSSTNQECSNTYCASGGLSAAGGDSNSASYTTQFGPLTNSTPSLQVIVDSGTSNLGVFSTTQTATAITTVKVLSYLSHGYIVQVMGTPPSYDGHTLTALSTPTASTTGTEQFGLNAVANTAPTVGADPVQVPSSQTSFGVVNSNYDTPNKFMYANGDTVAHSSSASGETDYTLSMIINVSSTTPAGHYSGDFSIVVTPIY